MTRYHDPFQENLIPDDLVYYDTARGKWACGCQEEYCAHLRWFLPCKDVPVSERYL
jgi:hypothetical protein